MFVIAEVLIILKDIRMKSGGIVRAFLHKRLLLRTIGAGCSASSQ